MGDSSDGPQQAKSAFIDLLPRIGSALVLAAVALALTYWGLGPFALLVGLVAVILSWEWGGMVRGKGLDGLFGVHAVIVILAVILGAKHLISLSAVVLLTGALIVGALRFGQKARLSAYGVFYAGLPAAALLWFRGDEPHGFFAIIFLFAVVWTTDIGAYAAGRAIGGPKLWSAVSPKKTWAGLLGGVGCAVLAGMLCATFLPGGSVVKLGITALLLALISQGGDLAESALKRRFDVKDSSSLIPGHGGFMDRVDGLVAAVVAAAIFALAVNAAAPARALLFWL